MSLAWQDAPKLELTPEERLSDVQSTVFLAKVALAAAERANATIQVKHISDALATVTQFIKLQSPERYAVRRVCMILVVLHVCS